MSEPIYIWPSVSAGHHGRGLNIHVFSLCCGTVSDVSDRSTGWTKGLRTRRVNPNLRWGQVSRSETATQLGNGLGETASLEDLWWFAVCLRRFCWCTCPLLQSGRRRTRQIRNVHRTRLLGLSRTPSRETANS